MYGIHFYNDYFVVNDFCVKLLKGSGFVSLRHYFLSLNAFLLLFPEMICLIVTLKGIMPII